MYLIFDTETTTFPSNYLDRNHPNQARMMQLGILVLDETFKEVFAFKSLIRLPEGKVCSDGAFAAHGISVERCNKFGLPSDVAIKVLENLYGDSIRCIGHNLQFDARLVEIEDSTFPFVYGKHICTMEIMTPICRLPKTSNRGSGEFKWPKLQEAYQFVTGKQFDGAHDALADVRATAEIFKWCVAKGHIVL